MYLMCSRLGLFFYWKNFPNSIFGQIIFQDQVKNCKSFMYHKEEYGYKPKIDKTMIRKNHKREP